MPTLLAPKLLSWASVIDDATIAQAQRTARLPIVAGHVALMPDAHLGIGATVGSVIPTQGAIIPAAVGVDIGCGMIAVRTDLGAGDLPSTLEPTLTRIEQAIPAGVGKGHGPARGAIADQRHRRASQWLAAHRSRTELTGRDGERAAEQFGTLGSGNHFLEICLDEADGVWVVVHSGSRGIGNQLAQRHIATAKGLARGLELALEDPDLAYLVEGTEAFEHYLADLLWAQDYAAANRDQMVDAALRALFGATGTGHELTRVDCHHNYTAREEHGGRPLWVTRKGAIRAGVGELGVVPGSMGARSFIVEGLGNPDSYESCSHGAGRTMSRNQAKRTLSASDLKKRMAGRAWLAARADELVDEHPDAYKDIDVVMADQHDLVQVKHTLRQILNYKGT